MSETLNNTDKQHRILIVDDDQDFLFQLKAQFEAAGFDVTTAHDGKSALRLLNGTQPEVAVVDLMMEKADMGFTLCYKIKKKNPNIRVIMVTSVTSETGIAFEATTREERAWIKADALLAKPIRFEQLLREVDRLLKG